MTGHKHTYDDHGLCFECDAVQPPSEYIKQQGLDSLAQVSRLTGQSPQTLINWHRDKPDLFRIVVLGCLAEEGLIVS